MIYYINVRAETIYIVGSKRSPNSLLEYIYCATFCFLNPREPK